MLNIQNHQNGETSIVTVKGRVNFEVIGQLRAIIREVLTNEQPKLLVINMEGVPFIDSAGIGLLVSVHNSIGTTHGDLRLCGMSSPVKEIFDRTNLATYFSIFATERDALLALHDI